MEAANVFNHRNYEPPNMQVDSGGFGTVTALQTAEGAGPPQPRNHWPHRLLTPFHTTNIKAAEFLRRPSRFYSHSQPQQHPCPVHAKHGRDRYHLVLVTSPLI